MSHDLAPEKALWWQKGIIYQIYPRSFQDSNGDGIGDLPGIISRLDYLAELGIDAIWLSPFYPSPMADFGYDVADYCDVDPIFGTLVDFDMLVTEAHRRSINIIIDFVPNHSSDQHPWFVESRSSRDNPKRNWYVWADPKPDGSPPNNWLSVFGGPAWTLDENTGQYYLHSFLKQQPDLNWRNPEVKAAMFDVMRFWLDRGVDGFRIDVAHFIMKDPELRDNPLNPSGVGELHKPMGSYDTQIHLYDKGHPDVHATFREMRRLFDSYSAERPRYSVGEIHVFNWDEWASYYGAALDELHMPFNFGLVNTAWEAGMIRSRVQSVETALAKLPPVAWPNYVLGNHDEHRIASRVGAAQARVAMMLLLTLRGTPTIYYGDEIGMTDVLILPEHEQDPWGLNMPGLGLGRDPERTPMQWQAGPNAGFAPQGTKTWLPVGANADHLNVETQRSDPRSMLSFTRQLIGLRRENPALNVGRYISVGGAPRDCLTYLRQSGDQRLLIALNLSNADQPLTLPDLSGSTLLLSTHLDRARDFDAASFTLRAHEGCIFALPTAAR